MKALKTAFFSFLFPWFPKRFLSRVTGWIMRLPLPPGTRRKMVYNFALFFKINMEEAEHPTHHYSSFNDFFTRKLKPGLRPINGPIVHPVDGKLTEHGEVKAGDLLQAKGWTYPLAEFLGEEELAKKYEGGSFYTYYLCPADYHRVHAPASGLLTHAKHIPGMLWPVNEWSVNNIQRLFNLNERVVMNFKAPEGLWSLVMVGATNVGHMTITVDPTITTHQWTWGKPVERRYQPALPVKAGDELGIFHLGSTVILVFEKSFDRLSFQPTLPVKMGESVR